MAWGFVVGSKAGGGLGDAPASLKQGIGQGLLPTEARSQGEEEGERSPYLFSLLPLPGSLLACSSSLASRKKLTL